MFRLKDTARTRIRVDADSSNLERSRLDDRHEPDDKPDNKTFVAEDAALRPDDRAAAAREPGVSGTVAGDRRGDRAGGGGVHCADGTPGHAAVPGGRRAAGGDCCSRWWDRSVLVICCAVISPTRAAAAFRKPRPRCLRAKARITLRTVVGKFLCTSATLASGIPLGREGPSVQVGAGSRRCWGARWA